MRTHPILTLTALALALASTGVASYLLRAYVVPKHVDTVRPASSSTASPTEQNTPLRDERHDHLADSEPQRLTRLTERIATLEVRLRDLEETASAPATDPTGSSPDTPAANQGSQEAKAKRLSEGDFGQWLDDALATGAFDRDATRVTMEDMATSLAAVPGITLADLQCGHRFCRASVVSDNGKPPHIVHLMGASPFIEAGFTVNEPDGGVRVYFTQPGQSLNELRSEAQESALRDMHPQ
jgi:hypothetical protein